MLLIQPICLNEIYYDEIYFNVTNKGEHCKRYDIDIMIEDEPKNINKLIGNTCKEYKIK